MKVIKRVVEEVSDVASLVESFYRKNEEGYWCLNTDLNLEFESAVEATKFFIEILRYWVGVKHRDLFCHSSAISWEGSGEKAVAKVAPEDKWTFDFKRPSSCGSCVSGQKIVGTIFGDRFYNAPFVKFHGDRVYSFEFANVKLFAELGPEAYKEQKKREADEAKRKATEEETAREANRTAKAISELRKAYPEIAFNEELVEQICSATRTGTLKVVSSEIAVEKTKRSDCSGGAGCAYFDGVRVFYRGKNIHREWQWRDKYSANADRHDLCVNGIGEIKVTETDDMINIAVELQNREYGNRTEVYRFHKISESATKAVA